MDQQFWIHMFKVEDSWYIGILLLLYVDTLWMIELLLYVLQKIVVALS